MKVTFINAIEIWNHQSVATDESTFTIGLPRPESTYTIGLASEDSTMTIGLATPDPIDDSYEFVMSSETDVLSVIDKSDNMVTLQQPTPQQPTFTPQQQPKTQHRQASIVILVPLILVFVAIILIKIGISTIIPLIGSLMRFTGSIWQSVTHTNAQASPHETLFLHSKWALLE
mgnify:CR=1 FL=1